MSELGLEGTLESVTTNTLETLYSLMTHKYLKSMHVGIGMIVHATAKVSVSVLYLLIGNQLCAVIFKSVISHEKHFNIN